MTGGSTSSQVPINGPSTYPSQSAVYAEPKGCNWDYSNRLVNANSISGGQWHQGAKTNRQCTQCPGVCPGVPSSSSSFGTQDIVRKYKY